RSGSRPAWRGGRHRRTAAASQSRSRESGIPPGARHEISGARNGNRPSRSRCPRSPRGSTRWPSALPLRYESLRRLKLFTAQHAVDNAYRTNRLADIMDPNDVGPFRHREGRRGDAPREPISRRTATKPLKQRFPRHPDDDRVAEGYDLVQVTQEGQIVIRRLTEADARVHRNRLGGHSRALQNPDAFGQEGSDLSHHVGVGRVFLHRLGISKHVHRDHTRTALRDETHHRRVSHAGDVVHDRRARLDGVRSDGRFHRVDREGHRDLCREAPDHRTDPTPLFLGRHGIRTGPRRLAADVDQVCPHVDEIEAVAEGGLRVEVATAVGERGKRDEGNLASVAKVAAENVADVAGQIHTKRVVLYPYAHLSSSLAAPGPAQELIASLEKELVARGFEVHASPFGYYKSFKVAVKGHPLSELSREIVAESAGAGKEEVSEAVKAEAKLVSHWHILEPTGHMQHLSIQ